MGNSRIEFMVSAIFLSLMIFHGTFLAQGRPLQLETKHENSITEMAKVAEYTSTAALNTKNPQNDSVRNWTVNDFQPTDPGHSPGAGHSSPRADIPKP
ncbi:hypothetical protein VIGAN_02042500 [Vigna angularis var. angularis]|uniref:Uncharacterized protein n=1 Tax=Vigna angularis var. angularis TaxID=157739 RepID=A0A0S3RB04_PHAAN|nr:hypothetical protein VIGAN_02042500 [Vigna angularis var. angularis]